jgi:methanogenic corrinoid protein MtbC1
MAEPFIYHMTSAAIHSQTDALASAIVEQQYSLQPLRWQAFGTEGKQKSLRDVRYHLAYLSEAIEAADESLFLDYVDWARALFSALGFADDTLRNTLQIMRDVLPSALPPEMAELTRKFVTGGLAKLEKAASIPPSFLRSDAPLAELAHEYLQTVLGGSRHLADALIRRAAHDGAPVKDLYLHVFQPVQRELGRLWQLGEIGVAQEHLATAITQFTMSQLYPRIFATERCGRRLLAACVSDELHELGIRMVADFFEMEGWDTYYLGASTPNAAVVSAVADHKPHVLALSVTMTFHVSTAAQLITELRAQGHGEHPPVLVGGYPFSISPKLWQRVGADAVAHDAEQAIATANRLLQGRER